MQLYKNTADALVSYLLKHGYPESRIAFEWGDRQFAIDIVVLANDNVTPISIFEIKGSRTNESYLLGIEQLRRAVRRLDFSVQCSLVFGIDEAPYFIAYDVTNIVYSNAEIRPFENTRSESSKYQPVRYEYLTLGVEPKLLNHEKVKKQERIDRMKWFCWLLIPVAAITVLVLDKQHVLPLTTERLVIIGAVFIVLLLPFFSEISIKDISMKRDNSTKDKN